MKCKKIVFFTTILITYAIYFVLFLNLQSSDKKISSIKNFERDDIVLSSCISELNDMKFLKKLSFNLSEQLKCTNKDSRCIIKMF